MWFLYFNNISTEAIIKRVKIVEILNVGISVCFKEIAQRILEDKLNRFLFLFVSVFKSHGFARILT
jgi:hypothetical protein